MSRCGQFRSLTPLDTSSAETKLNYLILASLDARSAQEYVTQTPGKAREEYLDWFWHNSAFGPSRAVFEQRARDARDLFGAVDLLNDDRVRTFIHYGPARRDQYEPQPVENESTRIIVNPAEIWSYDSLGRQFDFVRGGTAFKLVGQSQYGRAATMPALEQVDMGRAAPVPVAGAQPLGLEVSVGRLHQQGDTVQVELHYGIPLRVLAARFPSGHQPLVHVTINLVPHGNSALISRSFWVSTGTADDTTSVDLAVGREVFMLPVDVYALTVSAVTADSGAATTFKQDLDLLRYVRSAQPASDVLFYSLVDSTMQSAQFARPEWARVVPLVTPKVRSGRAFYALYEVYNLTLDSAGDHHAEAKYELMNSDTRTMAVVPTSTRFLAGPGPTGVVVERIHTMDLRAGHYLLVSRIQDLNANRPVTVTAGFEILPAR